ncbi:prolyl oligopeptidase family serine peptidase [Saccharopolyspora sp. NFXS83]|uniref:S9 family peptidase n=1 Tax=Saccharopolyspora sp. NFXS83 TaxID=2993560 RepID=UPI00224B4226|nr:prolyl oligopeptidase family serine peptidase [Saccharopolyspora sp. NFXS83]MCX2733017.1 prolyl oligopeptidase family serine peptidase [Saccharopolyspora sp. NFXS83]
MQSVPSFPRHSARTQGFTLGVPRTFTITPDGKTVLFLRSASGTDRSNALWRWDVTTGTETLVADPATLLIDDEVSDEEQARRERSRERATGITGYATDSAGTQVAFTLSGRLFHADLSTAAVRELPAQQPVADPRPDPHGRWVAYLSGGALRLIGTDGAGDRALAEPETDTVTWGAAEFIAAEEMARYRGYWWSPEGTAVLAARVDEQPVQHWYLADPADPAKAPRTLRYPAAGTANAEVRLTVLGVDTAPVDVEWDREAHPYLVTAHWSRGGPPLIAVQSRDQRVQLVLVVDPATGRTREVHRDTDEHWIEIKPGWPAWHPSGELVRIGVDGDSYRLFVGDVPWTPESLQVRSIIDIGEDVLISASAEDPAEIHLYRCTADGAERVSTEPGVHSAVRTGTTTLLAHSGLESQHSRFRVADGERVLGEIGSHPETPSITPNVELLRLGDRELRTALLLPQGHTDDDGPLPVLLDPYGGPQAQRVLARRQGYLTSQWFADQGYAVVVVDGRGMTGRGPSWDRAISGDLAEPPLQDQVDALHALAEQRSEIDLSRVAIRGWSFGGYLAALAVLRRPDVFHAAIAGAPVTDWRLYDTHYTERYLGDPARNPQDYAASSLADDAENLHRPLLLLHGTVDDNVFPAHSLRLSAALQAAARPHTMLSLPGVSHMPTDEITSENLLLLQIEFLRAALGGTDRTSEA